MKTAPTLRSSALVAAVAALAIITSAAKSLAQPNSGAGALFESVARTLSERFYDEDFRERALPGLIETYRQRAAASTSPDAERAVIDEFLANIPASHLALISTHSYRTMLAHLQNKAIPTIGFELIELEGMQFVHALLQGSPADRAGVRMGDRVISIDGVDANESPRRDWSTDDAALPDPPIRGLRFDVGEVVRLEIERTPGNVLECEIEIAAYSSFEAARQSARVFERGGRRIAYMQLHYIHMSGPDRLLAGHLNDEFRACDALILDLRGRGGNAMMVPRIIQVITSLRASRGTPVIALIDQNTRSAKEAIAWELKDRGLARLVGETTAGALLPATFAEVGEDAMLMYPSFALPKYSELIEGEGVHPDVLVEPIRMYTNGDDPLIRRALDEAVSMVETSTKSDL